jgi:hypothetical protein
VTPLITPVAAPTHRNREYSKTDFFNGIGHHRPIMRYFRDRRERAVLLDEYMA